MKPYFLLAFVVYISGCSQAPKSPLEIALSKGSSGFQETLKNPSHEIQIVYGEIVSDSIVHHTYSVDKQKFFYPASTVKMPVAFAAIKKAEELGISLDSRIIIDSTGIYPTNKSYDSTFRDSIRISSLVKKIFTVSDNEAYNTLYGWLGKDYINETFESIGLQTRIVHQLSESAFSFDPKSNEYSRKARVITTSNDTIYQREEQQNFSPSLQLISEQKGAGFVDSTGQVIDRPFDFSSKNHIALEDLLTILEVSVRQDLFPASVTMGYSQKTQEQVYEIMEMLPKDLPAPYDSLKDNYVKFFMFGNDEKGDVKEGIKVYNKVGWAYGYLLDVAYIVDEENDISFFLAAVIHVNDNQIYNDGIYEYEEIGLPFLDELGDLVYAYELTK